MNGLITAESFLQLRDRLAQSTADLKTFVVEHSGGGDGHATLAIAILLRRHDWDVEVVDYCASACAIYIFPAGRTKYLQRNSLLLFHGGPDQQNLMEMMEEFDRRATGASEQVGAVTLGQLDKEATITIKPLSDADREVRKFLSMPELPTKVEQLVQFREASHRFFQELGVNPLLSTYGQLGEYEGRYKAYDQWGFTYRPDSLRRLGIGNIELKDGEWHPERHPEYPKVYEVTFP